MKVRIKTGPGPHDTKIEALDADGVLIQDLSKNCYAYSIEGNANDPPAKARLFVFADADVTAEAEVVEVPIVLHSLAKQLARRIGNPAVSAAFAELLGISL